MTSQINMNNTTPPSKIIGVQFSMMSPEEIRKNSVVEISSRDTYINNKPVVGGLFDPRMGVLEPGLICPTDGYTYIDTPGYFGHIELARPVFHVQHIKEIIKISKCFCYKCSKLLINKNNHKHILEYPADKRWQYVSNLKNMSRCGEDTDDGCGCLQPSKIRLDGFATIKATIFYQSEDGDGTSEIETELTPETILRQFKRISDEDVSFIGLSPVWSRPEWMVCQVLPVPPPAVRPSVKHDAQQRSEDDLTHIYSSIIKNNTDLADKIANNASPTVIKQLVDTIQYLIAMIVNNKFKGAEPMAQRSGRTMNCIMSRLNSKNGRIRGNLMGKRVDFSARSVITGDPNLSIRQLGVPMKIAMNITKPITVNERNRDFLMKLIQNGPDKYPGAKILEKQNGESITLRYVDRASIRLNDGDVVHRHMMDGDAVLFNRQPSLHRMSMMCHIVKIMKRGDTFRMNVADTKPYNADFDGDEMNMHMPQNVLAETELKHLAAIPYQMISPAGNAPIIGIFQDSMLGSYRFTRPNLSFTPRQAMNLLMMYKNVDPTLLMEKNGTITNFDILTQILPSLTMKYKTKLYDEDEDYETSNNILEIRNGKYIRGQMEKSVLGSTTKGILHRICNDFGNLQNSQFVDDLQNVITEYMKTSSFSVGISDLIADKKTQDNIIHAITTQKQEVQSIIEKIHLGTFENNTSASNNTEFETSINNVLNKATEQAGKIGRKSLSKNNRFMMIVNSGSKGNLINISQMISCLGQTNVDGKRIPYGFEGRTLPHFSKFDDSPSARGFIENSYISGLTAPELFFHAMGGRIGLIDTAVKTSQTGYIQRRLIKGLEDIYVAYDMTCRNNMGKIIQFKYGDDGFDTTKIESQSFKLVNMTIEDIYSYNQLPSSHNKIFKTIFITDVYKKLSSQKQKLNERIQYEIDNMIDNRNNIVTKVFNNLSENKIYQPIHFENIINNIKNQINLQSTSLVDITPLEYFDIIDNYWNKINSYHYNKPNNLFKILYYFNLAPTQILINKRFNKNSVIYLLENIVKYYKSSLVAPGEMVGMIAAQSIGEPTTQMTLNTFHFAGVASKSNVTRGVPRIEECLSLTENIKNPSITIYLKEEQQTNKQIAQELMYNLEYTKVKDITKNVSIYFDPDNNNSLIPEDNNIIQQHNKFIEMMEDTVQLKEKEISKWVIRFEFDKEEMLDRNISIDDVHYIISNGYKDEISCTYTDFNSDNLIFRIKLEEKSYKSKKQMVNNVLDQSDEIYLLQSVQDNILNNVIIKGIKNISKVNLRKITNSKVLEGSNYITQESWVLDTVGTNLIEILSRDDIDYSRTVSNDIMETYKVLGIEAARQTILNEVLEVIQFDGTYINNHHVSMLADRMTTNKKLVSIFRHGINNDDIGPIAKASFEETPEMFIRAAKHAELDNMRGVSANVMCGQQGYFGTSIFQLLLDVNKTQDFTSKILQEETDIEFDLPNPNDKCSLNNIKVNYNFNTSVKSENIDDFDDYANQISDNFNNKKGIC